MYFYIYVCIIGLFHMGYGKLLLLLNYLVSLLGLSPMAGRQKTHKPLYPTSILMLFWKSGMEFMIHTT